MMLTRDPSLPPEQLLDLLEHRRYGVEYQPLVDGDGRVVGHEALARFFAADGTPLPPQRVFDALHGSPLSLFQVERDMKRLQLEQAPPDSMLFVNLDPDAFHIPFAAGKHPLVELLAGRPGLVVEIIENSSVSDAQASRAMAEALLARGVRLALDDIGAPASVLSLAVATLTVDVLKFDRVWLANRHDQAHRAALRHLVAFARETGRRTVLEGVEDSAHLAFAAQIGVDWVQGFLFRDHFLRAGFQADRSHQPVDGDDRGALLGAEVPLSPRLRELRE